MQEGTVAFLQMVKIAAGHPAAQPGAPAYLVHLRHPTTGGVFASGLAGASQCRRAGRPDRLGTTGFMSCSMATLSSECPNRREFHGGMGSSTASLDRLRPS